MLALKKKAAAQADAPVHPGASATNPEETADSFAPLVALQNTIHYWWVICLLAVLGGLVGVLIHRLQPPVYEAVAHFPASIDFISTGPLTQLEEDIALNTIGDLLQSNMVLDKVVAQAAANGITTSVVQLKRAAVLERRVNVWDLRFRDPDPQMAARLVNLWAEQGQAVLAESYQHALRAQQLNRSMRALETCLGQAVNIEPSGVQCNPSRFADIQADLKAAGAAYDQERLASNGLFVGLIIAPMEPASVPDRPVVLGRSQVVLVGCAVGLLLGIWLVQLGIPRRWKKGS